MKIKILKIDFRKGKRRECGTCPVALGCLRAAKPLGYTSVIVLPRGARFFWAKPMGGPWGQVRLARPAGRGTGGYQGLRQLQPCPHFTSPVKFKIGAGLHSQVRLRPRKRVRDRGPTEGAMTELEF